MGESLLGYFILFHQFLYLFICQCYSASITYVIQHLCFLYVKYLIDALIESLSVFSYLFLLNVVIFQVSVLFHHELSVFCALLCLTLSSLFLLGCFTVFLCLLMILCNFNGQAKVWDHSGSEHGCREEASTVIASRLSVLWWHSAVTLFFAPSSLWLYAFDFSYMQWLRLVSLSSYLSYFFFGMREIGWAILGQLIEVESKSSF